MTNLLSESFMVANYFGCLGKTKMLIYFRWLPAIYFFQTFMFSPQKFSHFRNELVSSFDFFMCFLASMIEMAEF
jgi:hypothetical protein